MSDTKKIKLSDLQTLLDRGITPSLEHLGEYDAERLGIPWKESHYNYRINPDYETKYILDHKNNILGHIALDPDDVTRSIYINPENRGQGIAYKAHELLASERPIQMDDANEPEIYSIWEKLKQNYPEKIENIGRTGEGKPRLGFSQLLNKLKGGGFNSAAIAPAALGALGLAGSLYSAKAAADEGDYLGAGLHGASVIDPTGATSAINQIKDRLATPTKEGVAASMQDINNHAHEQLGDYSTEDFSQPDTDRLKLLRDRLGK